MMKYRKKPIEIEALQWNGLNLSEIKKWGGIKLHVDIDDAAWQLNICPPIIFMTVETEEGVMRVNVGDYLVKGIVGELYPVKEDIFLKTYEKI